MSVTLKSKIHNQLAAHTIFTADTGLCRLIADGRNWLEVIYKGSRMVCFGALFYRHFVILTPACSGTL